MKYLILLIILSSCVKPPQSAKHEAPKQRAIHIEMGACPTYPNAIHYRWFSKWHNPESCNRVTLRPKKPF